MRAEIRAGQAAIDISDSGVIGGAYFCLVGRSLKVVLSSAGCVEHPAGGQGA